MLRYFTNFNILRRLILNKMMMVFVIFCLGFILSFSLGRYSVSRTLDKPLMAQCHEYVTQDHTQLESLFMASDTMNKVILKRIGQLEAKLLQLNLLGKKLVEFTKWDATEFDFNIDESETACQNLNNRTLAENLSYLDKHITKNSQQLSALYSILQNQAVTDSCAISGRKNDIVKGWISSFYGTRKDPITGRSVWHSGVDIAGKEGEPVRCIASGMVTFSGERGGYGNCLEINHGNGLSTRYAHNKALLVEVGDIVDKGQTIALLGQSGRATGPHVHFEVRQNGRAVDPGLWFPEFKK